ncbi:MAG: preprotein translocase subunit YajC [Clostridiales bacterium]|nr:preprotein translocase subunit YajC [Clostridiales bacterium]
MNPNSPTFSIVLMGLLILMIYFMMIRPQRKKDKADREMREAMKVGDEAITIGGIVGKIEKINEKTVVISTTAGKNKIEFLKTAIASVSPKDGGAVKAEGKAEPAPAEEEKAPQRDKKVTPKKLGKKSDD